MASATVRRNEPKKVAGKKPATPFLLSLSPVGIVVVFPSGVIISGLFRALTTLTGASAVVGKEELTLLLVSFTP